MKSKRTAPEIIEFTRLCYQFKRFHNYKQGTNMYLFDNNLHGYDCAFKMWLNCEIGITDLDVHLENIKKNKSISKVYFESSKGRYVLVNR